tara:strand:+ start:84 stop:827 length:744 start_codon:yes stop_codon:yes gene_type:complete
MRHGKKFNHLGRKPAHRKAVLMNMANSLITNKRISTTLAKAKALQKYIEPLITRSKTDSTHSRRMVFRYLRDKYSITTLFNEVANKIGERKGGYTRILKTGFRAGDNAEMCMIELVDYNDIYNQTTTTKKKRSRRGSKKKSEGNAEAKATETKTEAPKAEVKEAKAPKSEAKKEAPKTEKKEAKAPKAETKTEAPKAEVKEAKAPKAEAKKEAPKAEKKDVKASKAEAKPKEPKKDEKGGESAEKAE